MEIKFKITDISDDFARLATPDGQTIKIPTNSLPIGTNPGDELDFILKRQDNSKQLAKDILNEILDTNN